MEKWLDWLIASLLPLVFTCAWREYLITSHIWVRGCSEFELKSSLIRSHFSFLSILLPAGLPARSWRHMTDWFIGLIILSVLPAPAPTPVVCVPWLVLRDLHSGTTGQCWPPPAPAHLCWQRLKHQPKAIAHLALLTVSWFGAYFTTQQNGPWTWYLRQPETRWMFILAVKKVKGFGDCLGFSHTLKSCNSYFHWNVLYLSGALESLGCGGFPSLLEVSVVPLVSCK